MGELYQQNIAFVETWGEMQRQIRSKRLNMVELLSEGDGSKFLCWE